MQRHPHTPERLQMRFLDCSTAVAASLVEIALKYIRNDHVHEPQFSITGKSLTTAKLVRTESTSHPRVMGGICVIHASIPTGILQ